MSETDYLTEDSILPDNQNFVCLSFLTPKNKSKNNSLTGVKVRGVFEKYEDATAHASKLQKVDPYNNVFVGECGKWLPFDPDPNSEFVKDQEHANKELNNIMKQQLKSQEKAKLLHEQRKNEMIKKNLEENISQRKSNKVEMEKKLKKEKDTTKVSSIKNTLSTIEEQIKKLEDKKKEVSDKVENYKKEIAEKSDFDKSKVYGPVVQEI